MVDFLERIFILLIAGRKDLNYDIQKKTILVVHHRGRYRSDHSGAVEDRGYRIPQMGECTVSGMFLHRPFSFHFDDCLFSQESSS